MSSPKGTDIWNPSGKTGEFSGSAGMFSTTTFGILNKNVIGLSFSTTGNPVGVIAGLASMALSSSAAAEARTTFIPGALSINFDDKWDVLLFSARKWVYGMDNKVTGAEFAHCKGNKYET